MLLSPPNCSHNMSQSISLVVNCGFVRVAICSLSEIENGKHHCEINKLTRDQKFKKLFSLSTFHLPELYFERLHSQPSSFDQHCKQMLGAFTKNWKDRDARQNYISTFSVRNWEKQAQSEKARHSLANCKECARKYNNLQQLFPGPTFTL